MDRRGNFINHLDLLKHNLQKPNDIRVSGFSLREASFILFKPLKEFSLDFLFLRMFHFKLKDSGSPLPWAFAKGHFHINKISLSINLEEKSIAWSLFPNISD